MQIEPEPIPIIKENADGPIEDQLDPHTKTATAAVSAYLDEIEIKVINKGPPIAECDVEESLYDGTDPALVRQNLGTDFFFWIKESLSNQAILKNTAKSLIHNTKTGLLLVSPKIFKEYCEQHSLSDWTAVQKSFQSLRVNLKTLDKGENTFKVRVSGKRKISMLQCWIIPHNELDGCSLPKFNSHLHVLNIDN